MNPTQTSPSPPVSADLPVSADSRRVSSQSEISSRVLPKILAEVLTGCWRAEPAPARLSAAHIEALLPVLIGSGLGALAWRRLRDLPFVSGATASGAMASGAAASLGRLQWKQALDARVQERQIARAFELLAGEGIRALLFKGRATARVYPEAGLRAVGDIDLLIEPQNKAAAERLLGVRADSHGDALWDIKTRVPALYRLEPDALFARCERVIIGETEVAVLGAEDQLRVLCLHFLKHGAWRPLWACDIAAALEARPEGFNWELCLSDDEGTRDAIACAIGIAHQLLGAEIAQTPVQTRARNLPRWLLPAVLHEWETPQNSQHRADPLLVETLREGRGWIEATRRRWPNPIQTAIEKRSPLDNSPLPAQIGVLMSRSLSFLTRSGRSPHG